MIVIKIRTAYLQGLEYPSKSPYFLDRWHIGTGLFGEKVVWNKREWKA
jgi:hypothetical protein